MHFLFFYYKLHDDENLGYNPENITEAEGIPMEN